MPELPDLACARRYVDHTALHQSINAMQVRKERIVDGVAPRILQRHLTGQSFRQTRRHGKHLFVQYADDGWLAFHFGMTGRLQYYQTADEPDYTYVRFDFANGYHLAFVCPRTLARLRLIDHPDAFIDEKDLGPDALDDLDRDTFLDALDGRRGTIKGALMNQSILAGLGNIYADEVLYQAGIHPRAKIPDLNDDALHTLHTQIRPVLEAAIDHDANPTDLPADRYLLPHRYGDERCPDCDADLETLKVSGRTTYFCPCRQTLP
jgi:formamidopyrimidine-DNA glycosylase